MVAAPALLTLLVVAPSLLSVPRAEADDWDETRQRLIEPLNAALHKHWPAEVQQQNLEVLLRLYATDTGTGITWDGPTRAEDDGGTIHFVGHSDKESIRERYQRLLSLFSEVERAELRVDRVDWRNRAPLGRRATVHAIVRGRTPEGEYRKLEQRAILHLNFFDPFWEITGEEITERSVVTSPDLQFEWQTEEAGIQSVHANKVSPPFRLFGKHADNPVRQASGVAAGDADGDGCDDLLLAGSPDLQLMRGRCDGTFEEATAGSGLPSPYPAAASGVVFLDYDNDGWKDLFVAAVKGGDRLFRNVGEGRFVDVSEQAGIVPGRWGSMPVVADYDRDGFLDIYVARMGDHERLSPRPPQNARNGVRGTLYHNNGDGTFEDVSEVAGVDSPGWDMAAAWGDYTGDGWPDLYVANEFGNNRLFRNERDGTFTDQTDVAGVEDGGSAMGASWGDVDGDGDLDLFVSGMRSNSRWALFHPEFPMPIPWYFRFVGMFTDAVQIQSDIYTDRLSRGSSLLRNDGDGTFTDISDKVGVRDGQWGWAGDFFDYDNDGDLDLYAVNGFITGPVVDDL